MFVHSVWIGDPKSGNINERQDTIGPYMFSQKNIGQKVQIWCLDEHVSAYQQAFRKSKAKVEVKGIESSLKEFKQQAKAAGANFELWLISRVEFIVENLKKGAIRDRVNVKNTVAFFLAWYKGGYVFDTNVTPKSDVKLERYDDVKIPGMADPHPTDRYLQLYYRSVSQISTVFKVSADITSEQRLLLGYEIADVLPMLPEQELTEGVVTPLPKIDCWAIYSPPRSEKSLKMLQLNLNLFAPLMAIRAAAVQADDNKLDILKMYHEASANIQLICIHNAVATPYANRMIERSNNDLTLSYDDKLDLEQRFLENAWLCDGDESNNNLFYVRDINIRKITNNTHCLNENDLDNKKYDLTVIKPDQIDGVKWYNRSAPDYQAQASSLSCGQICSRLGCAPSLGVVKKAAVPVIVGVAATTLFFWQKYYCNEDNQHSDDYMTCDMLNYVSEMASYGVKSILSSP